MRWWWGLARSAWRWRAPSPCAAGRRSCSRPAPASATASSSRNSEVIHAGLYDIHGSLKATLCVAGRGRSIHIANRAASVIAAAASWSSPPRRRRSRTLKAIEARATANGVRGLRWLSGAEAREMEPALHGEAALLSSVTGIIDSHALMLAYQGDLENAGGAVVLRAPVESAVAAAAGFVLRVGGAAPDELHAGVLVNAAGLHAPALARSIVGLEPASIPRPWFAKGNYFALARRSPFTHLIYPVPEPGGLGVHLTLDLAGQARFGPDVEWLDVASPDAIDYAVDPARAAPFYAAVRRYWPGLEDGTLVPAYSGVRPKLQGPGACRATSCSKDPRRMASPVW